MTSMLACAQLANKDHKQAAICSYLAHCGCPKATSDPHTARNTATACSCCCVSGASAGILSCCSCCCVSVLVYSAAAVAAVYRQLLLCVSAGILSCCSCCCVSAVAAVCVSAGILGCCSCCCVSAVAAVCQCWYTQLLQLLLCISNCCCVCVSTGLPSCCACPKPLAACSPSTCSASACLLQERQPGLLFEPGWQMWL